MNIVQFIRLLLKHKVILITIPVILVVVVFLMTRNLPKTYESKTTLFTGITSGGSIESLEKTSVDFFGVKSQYDNLINIFKSRKTLEEVGIHLLAQHLSLSEPDAQLISPEHYYKLKILVPEKVQNLVNHNSFQKTVDNLTSYMNKDNYNFVYKLLNGNHPHYSVNTLSKIRPVRIGNSDIISIIYSNNDQGICQQTLIFLTGVFNKNYKELKEIKSGAIYQYFLEQLNIANSNLKDSEDRLLDFMQQNNLINYYEQTKYIASKKEDLEVEYQKERMAMASADSALKKIEAQLQLRENLSDASNLILEKRNQLTNISSTIASNELFISDSTSIDNLGELKAQALSIREDLKSDILRLYNINNTYAGINLDNLLSRWLDNVVSYEESKARLIILKERRKDFEKRYAKFAPLGATIKRIEREIGVNEQKYITVLHSLNLSKLKQQNIELSSEIKVVDKPFFPIHPQPSKRIVLVGAVGFVSFICLVALIFILEFLDTTIKLPSRAEKLTGLSLAGIFPRFKLKNGIDTKFALSRLTELLVQQIILKTKIFPKTKKILLFSTRPGEGKTTIAGNLVKKFDEYGYSTLFLNYQMSGTENHEEEIPENQKYFQFDKKLFELKSITELLEKNNIAPESKHDYIFIEIPSVLHYSFPLELISSSDMSLLVCRSNRGWDEADTRAIESLEKATGHKPYLVLNGIEIEHTEAILGEIPKKRSFVRTFIKKVLMLQFSSGNKIN